MTRSLVLLCMSNVVLLTTFAKSDGCDFPPDENNVQWIKGKNGSVVTVNVSAEKVGSMSYICIFAFCITTVVT